MPTQQDLESRFSFDNLASGDATVWQHARYWARTNPVIAATIREVENGYAQLGVANQQRDEQSDETTSRRDANKAQVDAQLARRGWHPDRGTR